jgi:uncharacterized Fe-S center protein
VPLFQFASTTGLIAAQVKVCDLGSLASIDFLAIDQASSEIAHQLLEAKLHYLKERIESLNDLRRLFYVNEMKMGND